MKLFNKSYFLYLVLLSVVFLQGCGDNSSRFDIDFEEAAPPAFDRSQAVRDSSLAEGLQIFVIEEGEDTDLRPVTPNDQIQLRYTGRIKSSGEIFDTSYRVNSSTGNTTIFSNLSPGGQSSLIEGFRKGLVGMKKGEKRIIEIPPALGYSNAQRGTNGFDLRDKTLVFDIELVTIF